jgi:hypothetical protein
MKFTPSKLNTFLFFKLPSAFWSGVRVQRIDANECSATVTHRWINQNPFNSIYFAVQAMAAELTTGALVMMHIKLSKRHVSMLVTENKSFFSKKARGKITFSCTEGILIEDAIQRAIQTGEGQTLWLKSKGVDAQGDLVSEMEFQWSLKVK